MILIAVVFINISILPIPFLYSASELCSIYPWLKFTSSEENSATVLLAEQQKFITKICSCRCSKEENDHFCPI